MYLSDFFFNFRMSHKEKYVCVVIFFLESLNTGKSPLGSMRTHLKALGTQEKEGSRLMGVWY